MMASGGPTTRRVDVAIVDDDTALVSQLKAGRESAFEEVLGRYRTKAAPAAETASTSPKLRA